MKSTTKFVVFIDNGLRRPPNVSSGSYSTSYSVIMPFRSIGRTSSQVTLMAVDDKTSVSTVSGEPEGTVENCRVKLVGE